VHGLVQNVFYGSPAVVLLALPLGLIGATARLLPGSAHNGSAAKGDHRWRWTLAAVPLMALLGLGVWQRDRLAGAWYADLGALAQARTELSVYDPEVAADLSLDQVRRQENLDKAIALLTRALQADPANATARQRLAAIDLARGDYERALEHAQAAWAAGHDDSVTRLLLGDALVANGRPQEAAEIVADLGWAGGRLWSQAWDRYWLSGDYRRAGDAWAAILLLDPTDADAAYWADEVRAILAEQN